MYARVASAIHRNLSLPNEFPYDLNKVIHRETERTELRAPIMEFSVLQR